MFRPLLVTLLVSSFVLVKGITGQGLISPCPDLLQYLPEESTPTSWVAQIILKTDVELSGVWLRVILDSPPTDVTSEFGEVVQRESNEYLVRKPGHKVSPSTPEAIKIKVDYEGIPPKVVSFRLNADQVCPTKTPTGASGPTGPVSPCPLIFLYDPPSGLNDQWTGVLTLTSDTELTGIYSRIAFDKPPLEVTSDFGEVVQRETASYLIRKPDHKLYVGRAQRINLVVKFDPAEGAAPRLTAVRLNAKEICPTPVVVATPPPIAKGLVSPCPMIFNYEKLDKNAGKWWGTLVLNFKYAMQNPQITLILDRPSLQIGGWTGNLKTQDNIEYTLTKPGLTINPGPFTIKFFIKYRNTRPIPKMSEILINRKKICPEDEDNLLNPVQPGSIGGPATFQPPISTRPQGQPDSNSGIDGDTCGTLGVTAAPFITHGQATRPGEHPWHVALYHNKNVELTYICGANLISQNFILTAAHCVTRPATGQPLKPTLFVAILGKFYLDRYATQGLQERNIRKVIVHPNYNKTSYAYDISLLRMEQPAFTTDFVRPICLWTGPAQLNNVVGQEGVVVGWGWTERGELSDQIVKTGMPIVDTLKCIRSNPEFFAKFTNDYNFCAGFKNGSSACNGDSGGGFALSRKENGKLKWYLRGLVSLGVAIQRLDKTTCDTSHYVIFTDVAQFTDWIIQSIRSN